MSVEPFYHWRLVIAYKRRELYILVIFHLTNTRSIKGLGLVSISIV